MYRWLQNKRAMRVVTAFNPSLPGPGRSKGKVV